MELLYWNRLLHGSFVINPFVFRWFTHLFEGNSKLLFQLVFIKRMFSSCQCVRGLKCVLVTLVLFIAAILLQSCLWQTDAELVCLVVLFGNCLPHSSSCLHLCYAIKSIKIWTYDLIQKQYFYLIDIIHYLMNRSWLIIHLKPTYVTQWPVTRRGTEEWKFSRHCVRSLNFCQSSSP